MHDLATVLNDLLDALVRDKKIIETTARYCIVNYLIKNLQMNSVLLDANCAVLSKKQSVWQVINSSIADLVDNQDLVELVSRDELVDYIVKQLLEHKLVAE